MKQIKFIDLFAGIGGTRLGLEQAAKKLGLQTKCVFSSENNKFARKVYQEYFKENQLFGDIQEIKDKNINRLIPDHNILIAGFPCQPFSHAGKKKGFSDTRGSLFFDIERILKIKKPDSFILENVKHLIGHDEGKTMKKILNILTDKLGYVVPEPKTLNSKDFGLPQNRARVFIVGFKEFSFFNYPALKEVKTCVENILEKKISNIKKYIISDRLWAGHKRRKLNYRKKGYGFGYGKFSGKDSYTNTLSSRYYKDGGEILIDRGKKNPRKLTEKECANLMGFPRNFPVNIVSTAQYYRLFGNSVAVPVMKELSVNVLETILNRKKEIAA